jgi:hypothetical protein
MGVEGTLKKILRRLSALEEQGRRTEEKLDLLLKQKQAPKTKKKEGAKDDS